MNGSAGRTPEPALVPPSQVSSWISALPTPIAITGGTGFVGSHLVDTLCEAGVEPRVLVRDPATPRWIADRSVHWVPGSLDDEAALERLVGDAGTVIHLAGVLRAGREADFDHGNRGGTVNLVRAVRSAAPAARFVHVSSLAAAGPSRSVAGLGPEAEAQPISAYGRSKLASERAVEALGGERSWVIVRPPAIYGPRDRDVFEFFRMANRGWLVLPAGERFITVAHVADVVRAVLAAAAADREPGRVYHVGEPVAHRLEDLLREIADAGGVSARVLRLPAAVLTSAGVVGSLLHLVGLHGVAMTRDKAREILASHWTSRTADSLQALGVESLVSFREGARETWAWYRSRGWIRGEYHVE